MTTIRRFYVYAVAFVSLETVLWGAIGLTRAMLAGQTLSTDVDQFASGLSLILVGIPVFGLHWWLAQRRALVDDEERFARLRAVFVYGALLATLMPVAQNTLAFLSRGLAELFGLPIRPGVFAWSQTYLDNGVAILVNCLVAAYFYRVLRADWTAEPQGSAYPETRRLYRYVWLVYGLGLAAIGTQQVLKYLLERLAATAQQELALLPNGLAMLLVGAPLWGFARWQVRQALRQTGEQESLLRLILLYALVIASIAFVVGSCGMLIQETLVLIFQRDLDWLGWIEATAEMLAVIPPFAAIWVLYARELQATIQASSRRAYLLEAQDEEAAAVLVRRAALRRVYYYILALMGLGAAFGGLQVFLNALIRLAMEATPRLLRAIQSDLAGGLAALIVGLPLWLLTWWPQARAAATPGESGDHARRSLVRKGYLYLVLFAGVIGMMSTAGMLLFLLLQAWLGDPAEFFVRLALQRLTGLVLFAVLTSYHGWMLRSDRRRAAQMLARRHTQYPVLVLSPDDSEFGPALMAALAREAPDLPVALQPYSEGAPNETLSAAKAVIFPAGLLARPSEALRVWLQGYDGERIVVPSEVEGWFWLGDRDQSLEQRARRAASAARLLAEDEQPFTGREASPWIVVIYVFGGLFALELLLALVSLVVSIFD